MNPTNLSERYSEYASIAPEDLEFNEDGESIATLHQTTWVRILAVRRKNAKGTVSIEVEMSLPTCSPEPESQTRMGPDCLMRDVVLDTIDHMSYLLELNDLGFELDVLGHDCLWTAAKSFSKPPESGVFEQLVPPSPKSKTG
ncbi:MAG: hypothetical protein JSW61_12095 [Candidatus Thorarchaeota archaeon]|nr:MAG: hypothetical protein JSW61_12095 [Candidatus Thorarchaeota archaeon]